MLLPEDHVGLFHPQQNLFVSHVIEALHHLCPTGAQGIPENPAAVLYGPHDLRYEQHNLPEVVPHGHLRVQIHATGICGSDLHFYEKVRNPCTPSKSTFSTRSCLLR